jgi:hypothetical protein
MKLFEGHVPGFRGWHLAGVQEKVLVGTGIGFGKGGRLQGGGREKSIFERTEKRINSLHFLIAKILRQIINY